MKTIPMIDLDVLYRSTAHLVGAARDRAAGPGVGVAASSRLLEARARGRARGTKIKSNWRSRSKLIRTPISIITLCTVAQ